MRWRRLLSADVFAFLIFFAMLGVAFYAYFSQAMHYHSHETPSMPTIQLEGETLSITIATTSEDKERGLGGRSGLGANEGMLFQFATDGRYAFWMKDMRFSIDIVWLDAQGRVVYLVKSVSPDTYPAAFAPSTPARYVLELPAGWCDAHGVKIGDQAAL